MSRIGLFSRNLCLTQLTWAVNMNACRVYFSWLCPFVQLEVHWFATFNGSLGATRFDSARRALPRNYVTFSTSIAQQLPTSVKSVGLFIRSARCARCSALGALPRGACGWSVLNEYLLFCQKAIIKHPGDDRLRGSNYSLLAWSEGHTDRGSLRLAHASAAIHPNALPPSLPCPPHLPPICRLC